MENFKGLKIEFHILQSFPVSCLNRDDLGAPKSAYVGGVNRARVSSQCWKRQIRLKLREFGVEIGIRTKKLDELISKACERRGADPVKAQECGKVLAAALTDDTLIFMSASEIEAIAEYAQSKGFDLAKTNNQEAAKDKKGGKKSNDKKLGSDLEKVVANCRNGKNGLDALDIALFGRMVASAKTMTVEAAAAFSHAITTHEVSTDVDYFTAIDDLQEDNEQGATHIGTIDFNSGTYYRYVCLDLGQLASNLGLEETDETCASAIGMAVSAFVKALVTAVPSGHQTTLAASCLWDYAKVLVRKGQALQMPFDEPVRGNKREGLLKPSIESLKGQIASKQKKFGSLYAAKAEFEWGLDDNYSIDELISDIQKAIQ